MQLAFPTQLSTKYCFKAVVSKKLEHLCSSVQAELAQYVVISEEVGMIPASKIAFPVLAAVVVISILPVSQTSGIVYSSELNVEMAQREVAPPMLPSVY